MAVPTGGPVLAGVYQNFSAYDAGIPTPSIITAINGIPWATRDYVSTLLNAPRPCDARSTRAMAPSRSRPGHAARSSATTTSPPTDPTIVR